METSSGTLKGSCACGQVRVIVNGAPTRVGLCHCQTCQKVHGSAFNSFAVFEKEQVVLSGEPVSWESSPGYRRLFCPRCGSRIGATTPVEVELSLGVLDGAAVITPQYESWVARRWPWLAPLQVPQHQHNRPDAPNAPYGAPLS
jgi:hypothetical protein